MTDPLTILEATARRYADARGVLSARMDTLRRTVDDVQRAMLPQIREAEKAVVNARSALKEHVEANPAAFVRPRTRTLAGIKVGLKRGAGKVEFDSTEALVARIRAMMPSHFDTLVKTTHAVRRPALMALDAEARKGLGVQIVGAGDQVVIVAQDDALDKVVRALLDDAARIEAGGAK